MTCRFNVRSCYPKILYCRRGVAAVEFALCLPLLLIIFFGAVEISRYFLAIQKVEKTIDLITDAISRTNQSVASDAIDTDGFIALFENIPAMMSPFDFADGRVIISDVSQPTNTSQPPVVNWQACSYINTGATYKNKASAIGVAGGTATLPNLTLNGGEEVIVGEIYYSYSPILIQEIIGVQQMSRIVYFSPRMGSLTSVNPQAPSAAGSTVPITPCP